MGILILIYRFFFFLHICFFFYKIFVSSGIHCFLFIHNLCSFLCSHLFFVSVTHFFFFHKTFIFIYRFFFNPHICFSYNLLCFVITICFIYPSGGLKKNVSML